MITRQRVTPFVTWFVVSVAIATLASSAWAHKGPDPVADWRFNSEAVSNDRVQARLGPDARLEGRTRIVQDEQGESLHFSGWSSACVIAKDIAEVQESLPAESLTVSAWVTVDKRQPWGGIIGVMQDNGYAETGWILGYNESGFYFAVSSEGADDGDGVLTYLSGETRYEMGKWYHVVGVYDGARMRLYVNGRLDGESEEQSGAILYPRSAPFVIGAYRDRNENYLHEGRIRQVSIYDRAAKPAWVEHSFASNKKLAALTAQRSADPLEFVIKPYLQYGTRESMTVMWQTSEPGKSIVHYGETAECEQRLLLDSGASIHEVKLTGLKSQQLYFYRAETETESGDAIFSEPYTFTTAVEPETPFAFAVIGDTQGNPTVCSKLCKLAWGQRPSFVLHAGDLVSTGADNSHWTGHFFPGMEELICRVPLFPVLGNHEQDARNYYDYMSLPDPEYFYDFRYGNAHFFMIDSNRKVGPGSEQYKWLNKVLDDSDAEWKFVCHHHPPYSSDENDYGDLWQTSKSTHGDTRVRQLSPLYEEHNVDIVWNGHIHSYERTWPVEKGKAKGADAPMYVITGGGGGGLETPGPVRTFFQNHVRRAHHYVMVHINGPTLEFRAYTLDDRLFDTVRLEKR